MTQINKTVTGTKTATFMQNLKSHADSLGIKSELKAPSEEINAEQLIAYLSGTEEGPSMELMFVTDVVENPEEQSVILQLMSNLDIMADEKNIIQLAAMIARINPIVPVGAFGISATNNVYMRHTILSKTKDRIDNDVIIETLDIMAFFINIIAVNLKSFVEGKESFEQCLKNLEDIVNPQS